MLVPVAALAAFVGSMPHAAQPKGAPLFDGKRFIILANLKNLTEGKVPMGLVAVC